MSNKDKNKGDLVVYDNTFNKTSLTLFTKVQINVLFAVLSYMCESAPKDANEYKAVFDFKDIRDRTGNKNLHTSRIKSALDKLLKTRIEYYIDGKFTAANVFSHYEVNDDGRAEIALTHYMGEKLNLKASEYTILELKDFVMIKNPYAKDLHRLLRQFKNSGFLKIKKEELLRIFNSPKSYDEYNIIRKVLMPAIEENKKHFNNLKVNIDDNTLPSTVHFTFDKQDKVKKIPRRDFSKLPPDEQEMLLYIDNNSL